MSNFELQDRLWSIEKRLHKLEQMIKQFKEMEAKIDKQLNSVERS